MMDPDNQEQMHPDRLLASEAPEEFGASHVQRTCGIGYNSALNVLERGVRTGKLAKGRDPWRYRVAA